MLVSETGFGAPDFDFLPDVTSYSGQLVLRHRIVKHNTPRACSSWGVTATIPARRHEALGTFQLHGSSVVYGPCAVL